MSRATRQKGGKHTQNGRGDDPCEVSFHPKLWHFREKNDKQKKTKKNESEEELFNASARHSVCFSLFLLSLSFSVVSPSFYLSFASVISPLFFLLKRGRPWSSF